MQDSGRNSREVFESGVIMSNLPKDPNLLYSFINLKLRDEFDTLDDLCASQGISKEDLISTLEAAGFIYSETANQFR